MIRWLRTRPLAPSALVVAGLLCSTSTTNAAPSDPAPAKTADAKTAPQPAAPASMPENFSARIIRLGGSARSAETLTIQVHTWSTPEERQKLLTALQENGPNKVLDILEGMDKGMVRSSSSIGWTINHAVSIDTDAGRLVRLITRRPIRLGEYRQSGKSLDYMFGMIQFVLDSKGEGDGSLIPQGKVRITKDGKVEMESLGTEPHRLVSVKRVD